MPTAMEDLVRRMEEYATRNGIAYGAGDAPEAVVRAQQAVEAIAAAVEEAEMDSEQWLAFEGEDEDGDPIEMTTAEEAEKAADPFSR